MTMTPSELARETLKRLAMKRTPPTPDNYRSLYHEIAGTQETDAFPERALKGLAAALPRTTAEQARFARQLDNAIGDKSWDELRAALADLLGKAAGEPLNWSALIRDIVMRIGTRQADITPARKREALEHVLASSTAPDLLYTRLQGLLKNWSQAAAFDSPAPAGTPDGGSVPPASTSAETALPGDLSAGEFAKGNGKELLLLLAQLLDGSISILVSDNAELATEAERLAAEARVVTSAAEVAAFIAAMKRFGYRLHFIAEDQSEIKAGLMHLLRLVIDNINELVLDDHLLQGQIAVVLDLVSQPPDLRRLDDVERRMKDVIFKQGTLKQNLRDAQDQIKQMLASFVDRLADFSASTNDYQDKIGQCAEKISRAKDISELTEVLTVVMRETRMVQLNAQRSHDELVHMRGKVAEAESEVQRLQEELAQASQMVRHDPLTGALNRKGMDDALETEVGRVRRHRGKLCLALLDIDNFKKLNDTLGHAAGDAALVHLAKVVQEAIRPEDTLARYGGEEFVVILPNTPLESAVTAMTRVQRELTRRFFLHNNEKVLITFSCGVAELGLEEIAMDAVRRADGAMYLAKRAGKNRVMAA